MINNKLQKYPLTLLSLLPSATLAALFTIALIEMASGLVQFWEEGSVFVFRSGLFVYFPIKVFHLDQTLNPLMQACTNTTTGIGLIVTLAGLWLLAYWAIRSFLGIWLVLSGAALIFALFSTFACNIADSLLDRNFFLLLFFMMHSTLAYVIFLYCINNVIRTNSHRLLERKKPLHASADKVDTEQTADPKWTDRLRSTVPLFLYPHLSLFVIYILIPLLIHYYSTGSWYEAIGAMLKYELIIWWGVLLIPLVCFFAFLQIPIERRMNALGLDLGTKVVSRVTAVAASSSFHIATLLIAMGLFHAGGPFEKFGFYDLYRSGGLDWVVVDFIFYTWGMMMMFWLCFLLMLLLSRPALSGTHKP